MINTTGGTHMAFKSIEEYNDERYRNMLQLTNDGEFVDVIFMYRGMSDVMVVDCHYIKATDFSGYVQCLGGHECPACNYGTRGISVKNELFIPVYVVSGENQGKLLFWDRTPSFMQAVLNPQVFSKYPNPSEFVFRITRSGGYRDPNTRFEIQAIGKNDTLSYDQILEQLDIKMPDYYESVCADWSKEKFQSMLNSNNDSSDIDVDTMPAYTLTKRETAESVAIPESDDTEGISVDF